MGAEISTNVLLNLSKIITKRSFGTSVNGTKYSMDITVLEPSSRIQLDQGSELFVPVSPSLYEQHELQARDPDSARGILIGLKRTPEEIAASFVLSTIPDHESLFGAMVEAGFERDRVVRAALHGIRIPLSSGINSKALFRTSHEYTGEDIYATQVHPSISNEHVRTQTLEFMKHLADATHKTLSPFVRELTGNMDIGKKLRKVAFDPISRTYLSI